MTTPIDDPASVEPVRRRAVLVDDDRQLLRLVTEVLQNAGFVVAPFDRFEDAKKHLAASTPPDILITDVRLGEYNGLQLAVMSKVEHPDMIVVVMTGYDDPVLRKEAENAGAKYLVKPVDSAALFEMLVAPTPDD
jgi:DNA-binding NtrC family response regulator